MFHGFIYITTNLVNGKQYIGQTKKREQIQYFGSGKAIKAAIAKYGKESFSRSILAYAFNKTDLDWLEQYFISESNAVTNSSFYNIAEGGHTTKGFTGKTHTEEHKQAIRELMLVDHPNKGKKFSQTVRDNMSKARTGVSTATAHSRSVQSKTGLANKGRKHTDVAKQKMKIKQKDKIGKWLWTISTPNGIVMTDKLRPWCANNGIIYTSLLRTLQTCKPHPTTQFQLLSKTCNVLE